MNSTRTGERVLEDQPGLRIALLACSTPAPCSCFLICAAWARRSHVC